MDLRSRVRFLALFGVGMTGGSECPACLTPVTQAPRGRPRIWCSRACQSWVQGVGGPAEAAEIKDAYADSWESTGKAWGRGSFARSCRETAAQCRAEAEALRALADA